jgi:hypothetical protein
MKTMQAIRNEKRQENTARASQKIENDLLPKLRERYPGASFEVIPGDRSGTTVIMTFRDRESRNHITLTVGRKEIGQHAWEWRHVLKVDMGSSLYKHVDYFKKHWGGNRLRTDIIDPKFDENKVFRVIDQALVWFNESLENERRVKEFNDERSQQMERFAEDTAIASNMEWNVKHKGHAIITPEIHSMELSKVHMDDEKVYMKISEKMSRETALNIIALLKEEQA